jgi:hypothetical protein|tara:strand:- start:258239 stop:258475 length:237 start_codon:yes stop_codon:yes gene_type:complete
MSDIQTGVPEEAGVFEAIKSFAVEAFDWAIGNDDAEAVSVSPKDVSLGTGLAEGAKNALVDRHKQIECAVNPSTPGCP